MHDEALMMPAAHSRLFLVAKKTIKDVRGHGIYSAALYKGIDLSLDLGQRAFVLEQPLLARQAAAIAGEAAVRADHAMAGHDDADRVLAVGESGGADGLGLADAPRQLGVADRGRLDRRSARHTLRWNGVPAVSTGRLSIAAMSPLK